MSSAKGTPPSSSQPVVLEINTWVWLDERSRESGSPTDLGTLTDEDWDAVLLPGADAVWLMGVWSRSPAGAVIARSEPGVRAELEQALPDLSDDDVVGSPYSVRAYSVDSRLGGDSGLATARAALARRGVRLLVDYVPNHVARDHPWVSRHPERFVQGEASHLESAPDEFVLIDGNVLALGRDPYFPPWTDVVQLDAFSPALRRAAVETLLSIAERADGVRCDMAMLLLNDVFAGTWGNLAGDVPAAEFWVEVIAAVKAVHPDFLFMAEAYWDLEARLLDQGFDYCYDKRLYDLVTGGDAPGLRRHLKAAPSFQARMVRFLENHDEPRSAAVLPAEARAAAAVAVATLPGALLLYEGQVEGRTARPPVQLRRRPVESADDGLRSFYLALLRWRASTPMDAATWSLLAVEPIAGETPADGLVAWSWDTPAARHVVVVNLAQEPCAGHLRLPWQDLRGRAVIVAEALSEQRYHHDGDQILATGMFVSLGAHGFHLLRVELGT